MARFEDHLHISLQYKEEIDELSTSSIVPLVKHFLRVCFVSIVLLFWLNLIGLAVRVANKEISTYDFGQFWLAMISPPFTYIIYCIFFLLLSLLLAKKYLLYFVLRNFLEGLNFYMGLSGIWLSITLSLQNLLFVIVLFLCWIIFSGAALFGALKRLRRNIFYLLVSKSSTDDQARQELNNKSDT